MTKPYLFVLAGALLFSQSVQAQQKKLTVEDAVLKARTILAPARLNQLQWIPQTSRYAYVATVNGKDVLVTGAAGKSKVDSSLTADILSESLLKTNGEAKAITRFPALKFTSANDIRFAQGSTYYSYNLTTRKT